MDHSTGASVFPAERQNLPKQSKLAPHPKYHRQLRHKVIPDAPRYLQRKGRYRRSKVIFAFTRLGKYRDRICTD